MSARDRSFKFQSRFIPLPIRDLLSVTFFSRGRDEHDVEDDEGEEDGDSVQLTVPSQSLFVDLCVCLGNYAAFT